MDESKLSDVPVLVFCNKCDLMNAMSVEECEDNFAKLLKTRDYHLQECSAKTGQGLQDGMEWLVNKLNDA